MTTAPSTDDTYHGSPASTFARRAIAASSPEAPVAAVSHPERPLEYPSDSLHRPRVEVVTRVERLLDIQGDYDRLNEATANTLPFALHEWHVAWWSHLSASSKGIRDTLMIHVVRDEAQEAIAIIPLVLTQRTKMGIRVATIAPLGSDPYITEIRAPLVAPGHELRAISAIQRILAGDDRWDWIHWTGLTPQLASALEIACPLSSCSLDQREPVDDAVLDLEPTWEALQGKLKRNIRESLRHCYNSLRREGLDFELEVAHTPAEVRLGVEAFLALHSMRAELRDTIKHPDRFASPRTRRFLFEVCDRLATRAAARVFLLRVRGVVVAARVAFVVGDGMYLYYSGFNPAWKKYGVMTTTVAEAIKYAISRRLRTVNFSAGLDVSKTRWGVRRVCFAEAIQSRSRLRSRLALAAYQYAFAQKPRLLLAPVLRSLSMRSWA
jgi:CelD/BcsL family acetyltransferase involved in cellulose biosynthesis